ncbi:MAG TPA: DUF2249 domain-containing protein [Candidatus Baltobacteraceae bacterium]|jgi:CRP-like cAMP-binding protein/uncharacterized protein (DUF2249 family)
MSDQRVDVRVLPLWERAVAIDAAFDDLCPTETLTVVTNNDPRALMSRMEQLRPEQSVWRYRRVGEGEWHVTLTRTSGEAAEASIQGLLRRSFVFAVLDEPARTRVANVATERTARKNQIIVPENAEFPSVGIVWEGVIALVSGNSGRERLLYEIFPFETFGEGLFFDEGMTTGRFVALSKVVRYVTIPRQNVRAIGLQKPELLLSIGTSCAQRVRMLASELTSQASQPILGRIAAALVPYAIPERGLTPALAPLSHMTQAQLAASAGTVKEVAARAIAELELREALRRERGHIRYLDREKLLKIVENP